MSTDIPPGNPPQSEPFPELYPLPNGMSVYHVNKHETDFLYKEIFLERTYFKHGIVLGANACVFDVGANIGMFTLFVKHECPGARVYAFEPTPELSRIITLNTYPHRDSVKVYQNGLSDREGEAVFTYYPDYSIMSGFHADAVGDAGILSSSIRNQLARTNGKLGQIPNEMMDVIVKKMEVMVKEKLRKKIEVACQLKTISSIIAAAGIGQIDLLKVDAERSELAILNGIQDHDWPKIKQMVLEVHSVEEAGGIIPLLEQKGFKVTVEQEAQFTDSGVCNLFVIKA